MMQEINEGWGMNRMFFLNILLMMGVFAFSGCAQMDMNKNKGHLQSYPIPAVEAGWIRNGEALEFEGKSWFPTDDVENLLDEEVYKVGEYKEVGVFVEKIDTKPYERLYTKFARGKFRYFERARND